MSTHRPRPRKDCPCPPPNLRRCIRVVEGSIGVKLIGEVVAAFGKSSTSSSSLLVHQGSVVGRIVRSGSRTTGTIGWAELVGIVRWAGSPPPPPFSDSMVARRSTPCLKVQRKLLILLERQSFLKRWKRGCCTFTLLTVMSSMSFLSMRMRRHSVSSGVAAFQLLIKPLAA